MGYSISPQTVGHFHSVEQKRAYNSARAVIATCQSVAEVFLRSNEGPHDHNRPNPGSSLLDSYSEGGITRYSGVCEFEPSTQKVRRLEAEKPNFPGLLLPPNGLLTSRLEIRTTEEGVVYASPQGTVRVSVDGTLFFDDTEKLPTSFRRY